MSSELANAFPKKSFFIQMFTKDISLEDCILDLVDNSIDGLIRNKRLSLSQISKGIFKSNVISRSAVGALPVISVKYSQEDVVIDDKCGGIDFQYALKEAFNFGHNPNAKLGYLGVYGIGLKRALFKIGNRFRITSKTIDSGFTCDLNVEQWLSKDNDLNDWKIPITQISPAKDEASTGTKIHITELHNDVKLRMQDPTFGTDLCSAIENTYTFFLDKHVRCMVNDNLIAPFDIPIGMPRKGEVSFEKFPKSGVLVRIIATIARPDDAGRLPVDPAGWYVVCNGRVVLAADKTSTTGWGVAPMPLFVSKFRAFLGFVFFESVNPLLLPWTTTKRDLSKEAAIFLFTKNRMALAARPVISFCNRKYGGEGDEEPIEREISKEVTSTSLSALISRKSTVFSAPPLAKLPVKTTTQVQYEAEDADLEKVRKHLRDPRMAAYKIGIHTFEYFLKQEGLK